MTDDGGSVSTVGITIERTFDAPHERVWDAWTDPEQLAAWYGPPGWSLPVCDVDFEVGGVWHSCMRSPDGDERWVRAVYDEIVEPERIVMTDMPADENGDPLADAPEMQLTLTFAERADGGTDLTLRHEGFPSEQASQGAEGAWRGSLEALADHVAT